MGSFNNFGEIGNAIIARGSEHVAAYAAYWENAAAQLAPVDTGDLRNSAGHEITGPHEAKVFATMEYAVHQEYGTVDMPAQPFMRPSRDALAAPFKSDLRKLLKP